MKNRPRHICRGRFFYLQSGSVSAEGRVSAWGSNIAAPPDGEAFARPARPTRSLRAPHRHDFDARAFTRALYAGGQNHAGPANVLSGASRLSGLSASLRPSFVAATALRQKNACRRNTPSASAHGTLGSWGAFFFVVSALADVPSARLTLSAAKPPRYFCYNTHILRGACRDAGS